MFSQKVLIGIVIIVFGLVFAALFLTDQDVQESNLTEMSSTEVLVEEASEEDLPRPPYAPSDEELQENCTNFGLSFSELVDDIGVAPRLVTVRAMENPDEEIYLPYNPENNFAGCSDAAKEVLESIEYYPY